jgi:hypothetical protein
MAALSPECMGFSITPVLANGFGSGDNRRGSAIERHRTKPLQPHRASLRSPWKQDTGGHEAGDVCDG